jgi:hypothetical protein
MIAGLPIKIARDAIREMHRNDFNDYGWSVNDLAAYMEVSSTHAEWLCEILQKWGVLERKPQPDARWHPRGTYYRVSETGTRFTMPQCSRAWIAPRLTRPLPAFSNA